MSRPRGPRQRGAPAPPPPLLRAAGGCSACLQLYSQAGTARAAGGGGPRGAGAGGGARRLGEGARTPSPAARAPCGGRGPGKGARWGRGRAAAASASCAPGGSRCTSRPPLPPEPGPDPGPEWVVGGAERGTGCGAAGEWGAGRPPQPGEVLEVRGMGRNPAIRSYSRSAFTWCPFPQMRPNRGPGCGASPRPHLWPGPRASSAPRARPALHPHKLVSLLCWALLELVPLTPRFNLFSWGFILRRGHRGRWLSSSTPRQRAPGFLPQGGLGCPLWQEVGPGAPAWRCMRSGCTGFPRLLERPSPRSFWPLVPPVDLQRPSADTCRVTRGPRVEPGATGT